MMKTLVRIAAVLFISIALVSCGLKDAMMTVKSGTQNITAHLEHGEYFEVTDWVDHAPSGPRIDSVQTIRDAGFHFREELDPNNPPTLVPAGDEFPTEFCNSAATEKACILEKHYTKVQRQKMVYSYMKWTDDNRSISVNLKNPYQPLDKNLYAQMTEGLTARFDYRPTKGEDKFSCSIAYTVMGEDPHNEGTVRKFSGKESCTEEIYGVLHTSLLSTGSDTIELPVKVAAGFARIDWDVLDEDAILRAGSAM